MALFPDCDFEVLLPRDGVVAGERLEGTVVLLAKEDIRRAERLDLAFISTARAVYGSGQNQSVRRATMFHAPLEMTLPGSLAKGRHEHRFSVDIPSWLPPGYDGDRCSVWHEIAVRLDVDWAIDPTKTFAPKVIPLRRRVNASRVQIRSGPSFHDSIIVEIALQSTSVVQGGAIEGSVAVRNAKSKRFDAVELAIVGSATMALGRGDRRRGFEKRFRIEAERFPDGRSVPFSLPIDATVIPSFTNGFIDHDVMLEVRLDIPWASDPSFGVPLEILPPGSVVEGGEAPPVVGSDRTKLLARSMARASGLGEGTYPTLVEDVAGHVALRVIDGPRDSRPGIDVSIDFASVDLGLELRPERLLDFRRSPLLPDALASRYFLRRTPEAGAGPVADEAVAAFVAALCRRVEDATAIQLGDSHLGFHVAVEDDSEAGYQGLAALAKQKSEDVVDAIAALPFPRAISSSEPAWRAMAAEHGAALVPSRPAIHGVVLGARVHGGEERSLRATLRAEWKDGAPVGARWDVDLAAMPLPEKVRAELEAAREKADALPASLGALFASIEVQGRDAVSLAAEGWHDDPRSWLPGLEIFFAWVLEVRRERRVDSPYR